MADVIDIVELRRLPRDIGEMRMQLRVLDDRFSVLEQRFGGLERRVAEAAVTHTLLREDVQHLDQKVDIGFGDVNGRLDRVIERQDAMEARLSSLEDMSREILALLRGQQNGG